MPYHSEHETGLAIDVCVYNNYKYVIEHDIKSLKETKWIHEHAHNYGFILRYPKEKEKMTEYSYELWHLRYVGNSLATYLYKNNLTLEEYYNNTFDFEKKI